MLQISQCFCSNVFYVINILAEFSLIFSCYIRSHHINKLIKVFNSKQVISARKGEFETGFDRGGQTREHAMLAKTAGVKHLVVLVNKMDDPTVNWDEAR